MEKEIKEIPFGAKDSELYKFEYTIPEGYEAEIKDGKVIVKKKESEDERIMKSLVEYFRKFKPKDMWDEMFSFGDVLSYLERQKESQPLVQDGEIEDKKRDIIAAIRKYYPKDYAEYLTSFLKGLSPEDNSEDEYGQKMLAIAYKLMYEHIPENLRTKEFWDSLKFMREYTGKVAIIHSYEQPAEWSEEDERLLTKLTTYVDIECFDREYNGQDVIDWLKSLSPKPRWKPSKEQMKALNDVANNGVLLDLFNDLLKLL